MKKNKTLILSLIIYAIFLFFVIGTYIVKLFVNNKLYIDKKDNNEEDKSIINKVDKVGDYKKPPIPEGFRKVDTEGASWNTVNGNMEGWNEGLVISDDKGNEFVWVPVIEKEGYIVNLPASTWDDDLPKGVKSELDQIEKYGGFYISRYEAGVPESMKNQLENIDNLSNNKEGIPVSKSGVRPWNFIDYKTAKKNAEAMYKLETIKSGLPTNTQYKVIDNWIKGESALQDDNVSGYYSKNHGSSFKKIDYSNMQEFKDAENLNNISEILFSCGINKSIKNIYDLRGNLSELTTRYQKGYCFTYGSNYDQANDYRNNKYWIPESTIGFRIVLYIY